MKDETTTFGNARAFLKKYIDSSEYIVIKLGTHLLSPMLGTKKNTFFEGLSKEVKKIKEKGKNIVIISSGAVGLGKRLLASDKQMLSLVDRQAFAALGQSLLIDLYRDHLSRVGILAAQILVSNADFKNRNHYKNLKNTIDQLFKWQAIPIVNENDTVAVDELKFGDNDSLASAVAGMYPQSLLIILSIVDGFYADQKRKLLVQRITPLDMQYAGQASFGGMGGMKTKLMAARNVIRSGQVMNINSGENPSILSKIMNAEETGTWFFNTSDQTILNHRKRWVLNNPFSSGSVVIDQGAEQAIRKSASLLGVGVQETKGKFSSGDVILIKNKKAETVAKGISSIASNALEEIRNKKGVAVVHRDNLVLI